MASEHHLEVYKGRAGCFRLVTLALGFELRQSCSAVARHSNTSFLRHDLVSQRRSRFMFFIVSWRSFQISHHHLTARLFQVFQFVRVATRYLHLWTAPRFKLGTQDVWLLSFLIASVRVCKSCVSIVFA